MGFKAQSLFWVSSLSIHVHQALAVHTSLAPPATIYSGGKPITTSIATHVFPDAGDNSFLRPSAGEVLTAGSTYTIKWNRPAGSLVNINVNGGGARNYGELCLGWVINSRCGGLGLDVPNTGSFEWKLAIPPDYVYYGPEGEVFWLSMWQNGKSNLDAFALPNWQYSANFTIVKSGGSVASTTSPNLPPSSKTSSPPKSTTPAPTTAALTPTYSLSKSTTPAPSSTFSISSSSSSTSTSKSSTLPTSSLKALVFTESPIPIPPSSISPPSTSSPKTILSNPISDLSTTSTLPCCFSIATVTDILSTSTPTPNTTATLSNSTSASRTSQQTSRASVSSSASSPTANSGPHTRTKPFFSWLFVGWLTGNVYLVL